MKPKLKTSSNPGSTQETTTVEVGGVLSRRGFSYQDEIAVGFLIEMLDGSEIEEIQCETYDDIVLLRQAITGPVVEFVQVKSGKSAPRSVSDICARKKKAPGSSILEKSLLRDQVEELAQFRLVTSSPVAKELEYLTLPRDNRDHPRSGMAKLKNELMDRLPGLSSPNGNDIAYWTTNCFWEVRAGNEEIREVNFARVTKLTAKRGFNLNAVSVEKILSELRYRARSAAENPIDLGVESKTIKRAELEEWCDQRARELSSLSQLISEANLELQIEPISKMISNSKGVVDKKAFRYLQRSLRWNYIAEDADVPRSLYGDIWPRLTEENREPILICIRGEPLSGKSTLMWRLGYDANLLGLNVYQVRDSDKSIWSKLSGLVVNTGEKLLVLVDDIFEDPRALKSISSFFEVAASANARLVVLSTTMSDIQSGQAINDLRRSGVNVIDEFLDLTLADKERFIQSVPHDPAANPIYQSERILERIDKFHALAATLREIDEGNLSEKDVSSGFIPEVLEARRLERLRNYQPRLWSAYKYVTFCHRLKIMLPDTILKRVEGFEFYDIDQLDGADAFLTFQDSFAAGRGITSLGHRNAMAQHWKLAETHWQAYLQYASPAKILRSIIESADVTNSWHGGFITHLVRSISRDPAIPWREVLPDYLDVLRELQSELPVEHLAIWKSIYTSLGLSEEAQRCGRATRTKEPSDATDAVVQIRIFEQKRQRLMESLRCNFKSS